MLTGLPTAIESLYRIFARFPLIEDVSYCRSHCVTAEEVAALHSTPLREIDHAMMALLEANPGTWGDDAYFYHFAPRYLELATLPGGTMFHMFVRLRSIWLYGPPEGQAAVTEFMWEWWHHAASAPLADQVVSARELLTIIEGCDRRVDVYLASWPTGLPADVQLANTVRDLHASVQCDNQFWHDVNAWLFGPMPSERLDAAVAAAPANGLGADDIRVLADVRDHHVKALRHHR